MKNNSITSLTGLALLAAVASSVANAAPVQQPTFECTQHFPGGKPPQVDHTIGQLRALCFNEMAILHSGDTKTAVYSVQRVDRASMAQAKEVPRRDRFYAEARLPERERATLEDYKNSGYDRGHLSPAATQATPEGMAQSFSLANMVPQNPTLNRGPWKQVETAVQKHAERSEDPLFIFTGPVYLDETIKTIGNGVGVPSHIFKVVVDPKTAENHGWIMTNDGNNRMGKPIEMKQIEAITGIKFTP